jgi:glycosyltransferase involved in cell wall biosynthesis
MHAIAYVITELDRGGAELALRRLVQGLDRSRFRAVVFSLTDDGPVGEAIRRDGIAVHALRAQRRPARALLEFVRRLRDLRPAILHAFLFHANVFGCLAGRLAGVPRVIASLRVCEEGRPRRAAIERLALRLADRIVCVAAAVRDHARRKAGLPADRLVVIPNGIEIPHDSTAGPRPFRRRVLTVAHLRPQKGIEDLLRAVPAVLAAVPDASFTIVGRDDAGGCRRMARSIGVESAVRFAGETDAVGPFYDDADLFVLPSRWEGCPNTVLEAMAAALPVVATSVGGTPELVVEGTTGLLAPPRSPAALARRIVELLQDPARARAMGAAGRARVAAEFSTRRMVEAHEALYLQPGSDYHHFSLFNSEKWG